MLFVYIKDPIGKMKNSDKQRHDHGVTNKKFY